MRSTVGRERDNPNSATGSINKRLVDESLKVRPREQLNTCVVIDHQACRVFTGELGIEFKADTAKKLLCPVQVFHRQVYERVS